VQVESFKVFRDLVDTQSFSKAAHLNHITQSAVSQQIRALEERFNIPLLERTSKRLSLTREGDLLYQTSKQIINQFDSLQYQIDEMRNVVSGSLKISTIHGIGLHFLPPYLKAFMKKFPDVEVRLNYRTFTQVYEEVDEGIIDLGLLAFATPKKHLQVETFYNDQIVAICTPNHKLANKTSVTLEELVKHDIVGLEPQVPTQIAVNKIAKEKGLEIIPTMEFDNVELVKRAVEIEAGIGIVGLSTVEQEVKYGVLKAIKLTGGNFDRPLALIYRKSKVISPALKHFTELLKQPLESVLKQLANN
jgi:DNA-binding transcriptional LysR family regulator